MPKDMTADQIGPIHIPAGERRKAARYIAAHATNAADCTELLAMLALLPTSHPAMHRPDDHGRNGYKQGCRCVVCRKAKAKQDRERRAATKKGDAA